MWCNTKIYRDDLTFLNKLTVDFCTQKVIGWLAMSVMHQNTYNTSFVPFLKIFIQTQNIDYVLAKGILK